MRSRKSAAALPSLPVNMTDKRPAPPYPLALGIDDALRLFAVRGSKKRLPLNLQHPGIQRACLYATHRTHRLFWPSSGSCP